SMRSISAVSSALGDDARHDPLSKQIGTGISAIHPSTDATAMPVAGGANLDHREEQTDLSASNRLARATSRPAEAAHEFFGAYRHDFEPMAVRAAAVHRVCFERHTSRRSPRQP